MALVLAQPGMQELEPLLVGVCVFDDFVFLVDHPTNELPRTMSLSLRLMV